LYFLLRLLPSDHRAHAIFYASIQSRPSVPDLWCKTYQTAYVATTQTLVFSLSSSLLYLSKSKYPLHPDISLIKTY
jgi:hypothetical protein